MFSISENKVISRENRAQTPATSVFTVYPAFWLVAKKNTHL